MKIAHEKLILENIEWKEFKISEIFEIHTGALIHQKDIKVGTIPRITATDFNNGVAFFTNYIKHKNFRTLENFISISFLGSVFYQPKKVSLDMKIHGIKAKNKEFNHYLALFLIPLIKKFTFKYCYGYQLSTSVLKNQKLLLPVDSTGNPNWEFMENYMKNIEKAHLEKITAYYHAKLKQINNGGGVIFTLDEYRDFIHQDELKNIQWKEFVIGEIFEIQATINGIDKNKLNGKKGDYPYVTRSDKTNGIDDFIAMQDAYKFNKSNVITIGLDTQTAFYQNSPFYTGQNIQILKYKEINKHNALFIIITLKKLMKKFSWGGNGATLTRLKRGKILLPVDSTGNPNWEFMENYMKNIELQKIQKLIKYYQEKYLL
ncbi:restriction endonuclease subunit S [Helicobacter anatolicus]|uniref:restriction endonuclease subunit S n=1 Tax=Helicobacter anatolicus TaxID=2905874 RepID=UPI001E4C3121|nr:restriction endonuclease subunit S [Helicobacter anatolicus]MCE3038218.1 restriction endonuclease subunit S [Helicobacter anatolicus]